MLQSTCQPEQLYLGLGERYKAVLTLATPNMYSTLVILEGSGGLRESHYTMAVVCTVKGRDTRQSMGVPEAELKLGWETHPAPRTIAGDVHHASDSALGPSSPYLHSASPLTGLWEFGPQVSLYSVKLASSRAVPFTVGRKVLWLNGHTFCPPQSHPPHVLGSKGLSPIPPLPGLLQVHGVA